MAAKERETRCVEGLLVLYVLCAGMCFEIIWNDLKCILFKKYSFLFLQSLIHVHQYEMPVLPGSATLSMNLAMDSELVPTVLDTPVDSAILCLHRIKFSSSSSSVVLSSPSNCAAGFLTRLTRMYSILLFRLSTDCGILLCTQDRSDEAYTAV
jgi:hypothetical protein